MKSLRKTNKKVSYKEEFDGDYEDDEFDIDEEEDDEEESCSEEEEFEDEDDQDPEEIETKRVCKTKKKKPLKQKKQSDENKKSPTKTINLGKKRQTETKLKDPQPEKQKHQKVEKKPQEPLKAPKEEFDTSAPFDYNKNYFYQNLTTSEWNAISNFIETSLQNKALTKDQISEFFTKYPHLLKGEHNVKKLIQILNDKTSNSRNPLITSYQALISYINSTYLMPKPSIFEVHFFPNLENEIYVLKMLSTCKTSIDIAIFTMTNQKIANVISNLYKRNVKCRIIADDECCKMWGSNIYQLAALGIPVKTDDSVRYHMHHKFAVIDNSVVITGSFNWTAQAVGHNQENVLFIENKPLAKAYSEEFQRLWDDFETVITQSSAKRIIEEQEEKKKAIESRKQKEKERKNQLKKGGDKENGMVEDPEKEKAKKLKKEMKKKQEENELNSKLNRVKSMNIMRDVTLENQNYDDTNNKGSSGGSRCLIF